MESESLRFLLWGLFSLFGFFLFILLLRRLPQLSPTSDAFSFPSSLSSSPSSSPSTCSTTTNTCTTTTTTMSGVIRTMSFTLLRSATSNFSALNLIKIGHSGEFFAGLLCDGEQIVVKKGTLEDLEKELELYVSLSDRSCLVPLLGYCEEKGEILFLVYQFMKDGDLATILARKDQPLPWIVRMKIAVEVSEALFFLHCVCTPPILHNDIKSSSIMVGANYEARVGSLSKAARVEEESKLSHDIFHFGMLLMDLISGLNVSGGADPYAQAWLQKALCTTDRSGLFRLIDPSLILEEDLAEEIIGVANIAKACLKGLDWLSMKIIHHSLKEPIYIGAVEDGLSASKLT